MDPHYAPRQLLNLVPMKTFDELCYAHDGQQALDGQQDKKVMSRFKETMTGNNKPMMANKPLEANKIREFRLGSEKP